jgi:FkbM family methyltransferase
MRLPTDQGALGKFLFVFRENYEPELAVLERFLSPGKIFIDVGANYGIYTLVASKLTGDSGRAIAFEPTMLSYSELLKNISLNNFKNVLAFRAAVSEKAGTGWLYYGTDPVSNSLGRDPRLEGGGEQVILETLDDVLRKTSIDHVDVIKIDAEGAEELVLRGASNLLASMRPVIIYEVNPMASLLLGLSGEGPTRMLGRLGYEFFVHGQHGTSCPDQPTPGYYNVVAIPKSLAALALQPQGSVADLMEKVMTS